MEFTLRGLTGLETAAKNAVSRRLFIGGSDARIIMSPDEAALIRLWKEKRGEVEPEDLQRQSRRPTRRRHRGAEPNLVRAQHRADPSPTSNAGFAIQ